MWRGNYTHPDVPQSVIDNDMTIGVESIFFGTYLLNTCVTFFKNETGEKFNE